MKKFTIALLSAVFVALIAGSIQSISADHESGEGIFKNESEVELITTQDSDYQVSLQIVHRNGDGHLISIIESTANAGHISHKLTDDIFDMLMGKKEIITIDNIKYEKVRYVDSPMKEDEVDYVSIWALMVCGEIYGHGHKCVSVFQASTAVGLVTQTDVVTNQWTILRDLD